jgi:hypothetical protein
MRETEEARRRRKRAQNECQALLEVMIFDGKFSQEVGEAEEWS